jgi:ABC-type sugar transport system permease subunit
VNNERTRVPIESEPSRTQDPADKRAQRRSSAARGGRERLVALLFLAPALVALVLFRLVPAGSAVVTSFKSPVVLAGVSSSFAGLDNYKALLTSPDFLNSVKTTVLFVGIVVPLQTAVALALALLLTRDILGARAWRLFLFLPFSVPLGISPLIWGVAMRPDGRIRAPAVFHVRLPSAPLYHDRGFLDRGRVLDGFSDSGLARYPQHLP